MKRVLLLALASVLAGSTAAHAQVFGQLGAAPPLAMNARQAGGFLQFSENSFGAVGQLRLSFHPGVDFGFQGGLSRVDFGEASRTAVRLGADFRAQVVHASEQLPLDLSLGGAVSVETADEYTLLTVGPSVAASRTLTAMDRPFTPYAGAMITFSRLDLSSTNQTDLGLSIRLGADLELQQDLHLLLELQPRISDDFTDGFTVVLGVQSAF